MKRLYVGNLPYSITEQGLTTLFSTYGAVENVSLISDRDTGRSKGFGFVEFVNQADAESALELNGKDFEGRPLKVNLAKPREAARDTGRGARRY